MQPVSYFAGREPRIRYWDAYRFVFTGPNGWKNLGVAGLCMLVPLVGPVVLVGWLCEVFAPRPIDDGSGQLYYPPRPPHLPYPDFDFNRFMEYLERGVWPFLAQLVVGFVMLPVMLLVMVPFAIAADQSGGPMTVLAFALAFLLSLAAVLILSLVMVPVSLRAAMLQDFGASFTWVWVRDFLARVGGEVLLEWLFVMATALPLGVVGYALCFVGIYPAMALLTIAQWHLYFQAYSLYLARGGTPLSVKPARPKVAPPVWYPPPPQYGPVPVANMAPVTPPPVPAPPPENKDAAP